MKMNVEDDFDDDGEEENKVEAGGGAEGRHNNYLHYDHGDGDRLKLIGI